MSSFVEFMNDCGKLFVDSTALMLIQSSVLIAILFGLDRLLRKRVRSVFRYCLWMLVLVKLVLPSDLSIPYSMGYWFGTAYDRVERSLPVEVNLLHIPIPVARKSSWESPEIAFDNPAEQNPTSIEEPDTFSTMNLLHEAHSTETSATNDPIRANVVQTNFAQDTMAVSPHQARDVSRDRAVALTWQAALFGLWWVVIMITGLLVLQKTLLIQRIVREASPANERLVTLFESCRKRLLLGRNVALRVSPIIPAPAVYGLFRPTVLIPERMQSHNLMTNELEAIFIHELVHIQRSDLWVKLLQTILQVVYFYNPLVWLANATIRRVRELAVDETVLVILGTSTRQVYPGALLKVAGWVVDQPKYGLRLIGVMESNNLLKERINIMLHKSIPNSKKIGVIGLVTLFILGVFLLPMARAGMTAPPADRVQSETETNKNNDRIEAMKKEIETLQQLIRMKLDELQKMQHQLAALQGVQPPQDQSPKFAAVAPPGVMPTGFPGAAPPAMSRSNPTMPAPHPGVAMMGRTMTSEGGAFAATAPSPSQQPGRGRQTAALTLPVEPAARSSEGVFPAATPPSPNQHPGRGRQTAALTLPIEPAARSSEGGFPAATPPSPNQQPGRGRQTAALTLPVETVVEPDILWDKDVLGESISSEVRKELLRILPELLNEMLPKLLEEAKNRP